MVLGPNTSTSQEQPQQPSLQRQALKRRRGLSRFYANKSQSFSCIQDLVNNPFSRSCISLAKRSSSWRQQLARCASVDEAGEDVMNRLNSQPFPCYGVRSSLGLVPASLVIIEADAAH
eukprot:gene4561-4815_t